MFKNILSLLFSPIIKLLKTILGDFSWKPPFWISKFASSIGAGITKLSAQLRSSRERNPKLFFTKLTVFIVLLSLGSYSINWYINRPKPHTINFSAAAPQPTSLENGSKPNPLLINFNGSAAPLENVGKEIKQFIKIFPNVEGVWRWNTDTSLSFNPKEDWRVGEDYAVTFDKKFFSSHVLLDRYTFSFRSPVLGAEFVSSSFYEDPTDPKIKEVVATLKFTHPIDKSSLERNVSFKLRVEPEKTFDKAEKFDYKISYDEKGATAYIHSVPLKIPENEAEMLLTINEGVLSARGGRATEANYQRTVHVPGIENYFRISDLAANVVPNDKHEYEKIINIESTATMNQQELAKKMHLYLLPKDKPAVGDVGVIKDYSWSSELEITKEVLAVSKKLDLNWIPSEREFMSLQSFKYSADEYRSIFLEIDKGLTSFGGYALAKPFKKLLQVPELPKSVKILHDGSLLSVSGSKKLSILSLNLQDVKYEVYRLLPNTINHLVTQTSGIFQKPDLLNSYSFDYENLAEVFSKIEHVANDSTGKNNYSVFDFSEYLNQAGLPKGLFLLKVMGWDKVQNSPVYEAEDQRIILVTDLALVAKENYDGTKTVFAQSIRTGEAATDVKVDILGKNGLPIFSKLTDVQGRVDYASLKDFNKEKTPTVYVAEKNGDLTFLPFDRYDRELNFSRFETEGIYNNEDVKSLQSYLFSDRGIYRPGDKINIGMILKRNDWQNLNTAIPFEIVVANPQGAELKRQLVKFGKEGFEQFSLQTEEISPTGQYQFSLFLVDEHEQRLLLGSTKVKVEEFMPDRLKIKAEFSQTLTTGWYQPDSLSAILTLENLYGTPAVARDVKGTLDIAPAYISFSKYQDYTFFNPFVAKNSFHEDLGEQQTDDEGRSEFPLDLARFERGSQNIHLTLTGFEPEGGRSVSTDLFALVSPANYLLGYKPDGDLSYIKKGTERNVNLIAIAPDLEQIKVDDLKYNLIKINYISVLTKKPDGTYAYQSVEKKEVVETKDLSISAKGANLALKTSVPGSYEIVMLNPANEEISKFQFQVIGDANLERQLDRNAELQIKTNKKQYAPGEEIELEIQAPYTGAGLITIERDKVLASTWFKTSTTSSVQKIKVPEDLEGNAYVNIVFLRGLDSKEIFMSPLSFGAVPFSVTRDKRTEAVTLNVPKLVRPGEKLHLEYKTATPTKLALFAVDEGILQVARYKNPDPLSHFFRKRALEVKTLQLLDLVLPEYEIVQALSAPGGDQDSMLARNLNPFKRRKEPPVAYWSGIIEADEKLRSVDIDIPDYYNGTIRVIAVAVSEKGVGVATSSVISQGKLIIIPTVPNFISPGDEFDVSVSLANNVQNSGKDAKVTLSLETGDALEIFNQSSVENVIPEGKDMAIAFRVKAKDNPQAAKLTFKATCGKEEAKYSLETSIRPASAYIAAVKSGYMKSGFLADANAKLDISRELYPAYRNVTAGVSTLPMGLATGLKQYLDNYPYGCTEQVVSAAFPSLVLRDKNLYTLDLVHANKAVNKALQMLQARQNAEGAFGYWTAGDNVSEFQTVYGTQFLVEAQEKNIILPKNLLTRSLDYLSAYAKGSVSIEQNQPSYASVNNNTEDAEGDYSEVEAGLQGQVATSNLNYLEQKSLAELRNRAYAIYVLTRAKKVTTNEILALREVLDKNFKKIWQTDLTALYLAASYKLLQMDAEAQTLISKADFNSKIETDYNYFFDETFYKSVYLYLLSKHFPERVKSLEGSEILALADKVVATEYNTLTAAYSIMAFDEYAKAVGVPEKNALSAKMLLANNAEVELSLSSGLFPTVEISPEAKAVKFMGDSKFNLFYQLVEKGFDKTLPAEVIKNGIEVFREYTDNKGNPTSSIKVDEDLTVKLSIRSLSDKYQSNIAIVDLLPGGFEADIKKDADEAVQSNNSWQPQYVERREDRTVIYGSVGPNIVTFSYKIKPSTSGKFKISPVFAESMYDRKVNARSLGGEISVEK